MKSILMVFLCAVLLIQCKNLPTNQALQSNLAANAKVASFGAQIDDQGSIAFDEALEKIKGVDSMPMKITANVTEVCQAKGCWMNVVGDKTKDQPFFVKFKDYGFFMPKDCAGKKVVLDGVAYKEVTSVDELRHYASDKGASKEEIEKITEPKEELKFLASGVLLYDK
jgi:hypothetical protein